MKIFLFLISYIVNEEFEIFIKYMVDDVQFEYDEIIE